jgi:hypothetical protein
VTFDQIQGTDFLSGGMIRLRNVHIYRAAPLVPAENHGIIDFRIDEMDVQISLLWWLQGKGLVKKLRLHGLRGVSDRRTEWYDPNWRPQRRSWRWGDFEIAEFECNDALITYWWPSPEEPPVRMQIIHSRMRPLRRQWLLYDALNADVISGAFDEKLFYYGPPQLLERSSTSSTSATGRAGLRKRLRWLTQSAGSATAAATAVTSVATVDAVAATASTEESSSSSSQLNALEDRASSATAMVPGEKQRALKIGGLRSKCRKTELCCCLNRVFFSSQSTF